MSLLNKPIGQYFILGFQGTQIPLWLKQFSESYELGGVILFDYSFSLKSYHNNILSPQQLKLLIQDIHALQGSPKVFIDQEGGKVCRLKHNLGFVPLPSHKDYALLSKSIRIEILKKSFNEMKNLGIDVVLAPVVDILYHPDSGDIGVFDRSFSHDPQIVYECALEWISVAREVGLDLCLKHYPGLGGSLKNSHFDLTFIEEIKKEQEILFFDLLPQVPGHHILVSHAILKNSDHIPFSLNTHIINSIKDKVPQAVVITDDLQMQGILKMMSLKKACEMALKAGNDYLCIGNNLQDQGSLIGEWVESFKKER